MPSPESTAVTVLWVDIYRCVDVLYKVWKYILKLTETGVLQHFNYLATPLWNKTVKKQCFCGVQFDSTVCYGSITHFYIIFIRLIVTCIFWLTNFVAYETHDLFFAWAFVLRINPSTSTWKIWLISRRTFTTIYFRLRKEINLNNLKLSTSWRPNSLLKIIKGNGIFLDKNHKENRWTDFAKILPPISAVSWIESKPMSWQELLSTIYLWIYLFIKTCSVFVSAMPEYAILSIILSTLVVVVVVVSVILFRWAILQSTSVIHHILSIDSVIASQLNDSKRGGTENPECMWKTFVREKKRWACRLVQLIWDTEKLKRSYFDRKLGTFYEKAQGNVQVCLTPTRVRPKKN